MQKIFWAFLVLSLFMLSCGVTTFAQLGHVGPTKPQRATPRYIANHTFKDGINVTVRVDSFSQRFGIQIENLQFAAQQGVRSAGWDIKPSSERTIEVTVDSTSKFFGDTCTLRIDVSGTQKFLNLKGYKLDQLSAIINRMVYNVALQMRKDIIENTMDEVDPEYISPPRPELPSLYR